MLYREWIEHGGLDDAYNRGRGPDTERVCEHRHGGETGILQQAAEGGFEIIHGSLNR